MKDFNVRRFCLMMRLDFVQNFRKNYFGLIVGGVLAYFLVSVFVCYNWAVACGGSREAYNQAIGLGAEMFNLCLLFQYFMGLSMSFTCLSKKSSRLTTLMLPASNLEKILFRTLVWVVGVVVLVYVTFGVGDFLRQIVFLCFTGDWGPSAFRYYLSDSLWLFDTDFAYAPSTVDSASIKPWVQAFNFWGTISTIAVYLWGSTVFRRRAFLMTTVLCAFVGISMFIVMMSVWVDCFNESPDAFEFMLIALTILCFVATVYLLWQTAYNFRHAQLVRRKRF